MPQTFSITTSKIKRTYSVDLLFLYLKDHYVPVILFPVKKLLPELSSKSWSEGIKFGPFDVIENEKKFKKDYKRILKADLRYPILYWHPKKMKHGFIVDGLHRLSKAYFIRHDKYIKVRELTDDIMKFAQITEKEKPKNRMEIRKLYKERLEKLT